MASAKSPHCNNSQILYSNQNKNDPIIEFEDKKRNQNFSEASKLGFVVDGSEKSLVQL